ncbi:CCB3/YggT [Candidatus Nanopelagicaceae bacterium]
MISNIVLTILDLFKYALFIRLIIDYVRIFARNWRPNSFLIAFFEMIYSITDPPMKFVGRFVPPLRLGGVSLDLSFIVLLIAISLAKGVVVILL